MIKGQVGQFLHAPGTGAEQQAHALADLDGVFRHHPETDFRAGKILHDRNGASQLLFNFAYVFDDIYKIRGPAMRKIEPEYTDASLGQSQEFFLAVGSRADGGDNLCFHGGSFLLATRWACTQERKLRSKGRIE